MGTCSTYCNCSKGDPNEFKTESKLIGDKNDLNIQSLQRNIYYIIKIQAWVRGCLVRRHISNQFVKKSA